MVGNAEPVKEYNYRPLSKLCECQLDVNDQVSTKGWGGRRGGGGQAEMEGKEKPKEREKEASTSSAASPSDMPASSLSQPFGTRPFWANTGSPVSHGCHLHCPPPRCVGVVTQVTCPCLRRANKSQQPAQRTLAKQ